ncbi:hypothetical protein LINPERPRIM_LOCUS15242 [Linum perenne]
MWGGFGGRYYWGRRGGVKREGIVVVFAWMSSQPKHVKTYVDLYSSLGWDSLVCHSQFLNMFFPDKAERLAFELLNELIEELKTGPCPLVFAPFSGGHYRLYPVDYKAAITELLGKAGGVYSKRIRRLEGEGMGLEGGHNDISDPMSNLRKAAGSSNQSFGGDNIASGDHFMMPTSVEYYEGRGVGSVQGQHKEDLIRVRDRGPPTINAHGVLGQILFDVCVPEYVEDWDIKSSASLSRHPYTFTRRHTTFNPMKCIRRSRL